MVTTIALMIGRFVLLGGLLTLASLEGALPLLMMALGMFIARFAVMTRGPGGRTMTSPLSSVALFHLGPVPITAGVVTTWAIMAVLVLGGILATRRLSLVPSATQAAFELVVDTVDSQIRDTMRVEPAPYRAFIGTLFVFIFVANWSSLVPGVEPPTAHLETDAALALLVFIAVIWFGIRAGGVRGYLADLCITKPDHDPAEFHRESHANLLAARAPVRQRDEWRLCDRHRSIARGPARADPADGARSPHWGGAGLHLRGPGDGVHRRQR